SVPCVAQGVWSQEASEEKDIVRAELATMGKRGAIIARAREQTLLILEGQNACARWFQESSPNPAGIFRSLHYEIIDGRPIYTLHMRNGLGGELWKHPWAANAFQYGGKGSTVEINANGAFFKAISRVMNADPSEWRDQPMPQRTLRVAWLPGNSSQAQF